MNSMFYNATSFNQPFEKWDVSKIYDMSCMFKSATSFNQDLSEWDLTEKNIKNIFDNCPIKDEYRPKMK
jgi:surface protein